MTDLTEEKVYRQSACINVDDTSSVFNCFTNIIVGYPLLVNDMRIPSSEALYQVCRFPHLPEIQRLIIAEESPKIAYAVSRRYLADARDDWEAVRIPVMRWCLRVKLAQHRDRFGQMLLASEDQTIVEENENDPFWGARPTGDGMLRGANVLGCLLMELRDLLRGAPEAEKWSIVDPLSLPRFLLLGEEIRQIRG